jgi:hypothetical protein
MAECAPEVLAHAKSALQFGECATMAEAMANEQSQSAELRKALGR